jgi:hypothetical protein
MGHRDTGLVVLRTFGALARTLEASAKTLSTLRSATSPGSGVQQGLLSRGSLAFRQGVVAAAAKTAVYKRSDSARCGYVQKNIRFLRQHVESRSEVSLGRNGGGLTVSTTCLAVVRLKRVLGGAFRVRLSA